MSDSEIIDKLISQMSTLNAWFIGYTAALVAVVIFVCGFIVFSQKSELAKMREKLNRELQIITKKEDKMSKALATLSEATYLTTAGRAFPQGIANWRNTAKVYFLAQDSSVDNQQYYLTHLKTAVAIQYYQQLMDEKLLTYDEEETIFHSQRMDHYDVITQIDFDKLTKLLKNESDENNVLTIFDDLSKFKDFWENK